MAKLSQCAGFDSKIKKAWDYCEQHHLLRILAGMSSEWKEIDDEIRYDYGARQQRVPADVYLTALKTVILDSKEARLKERETLTSATLCLYQLMEVNLPEKSEDGRL